MLMRLDALAQDIKIPRRHARDAAEDELQSGIEQLERFGPLPRFVRVLLFGVLFDLPGTPNFVADGPVFDLVVKGLKWVGKRREGEMDGEDETYVPGFFAAVLAAEVGVVRVAFAVAVFDPGKCLLGVSIVESLYNS